MNKKTNHIQMRWINKVEQEYAKDPITIYILLSGMPALIAIFFLLLQNLLFGIFANTIYYLSYIYITKREKKKLEATQNWLSVEADVLSVQIVSLVCFFWRARPFYPKITYVYKVEDTQYISDNVFFKKCTRIDTHDEAVALAKTLISDKRVRCFVNPDDHSQSFLLPEFQDPHYFLMGLMFFFLSFIVSYVELFY